MTTTAKVKETATKKTAKRVAPIEIRRNQYVKLKLTFRSPSGKRVNKNVARSAEDSNHAKRGSVSANNKLFPSGDLNPVNTFDQGCRNHLNSITAPLNDDGQRLLPSCKTLEVFEWFKRVRSERETLVNLFLDSYESRVENARNELGELFDETKYPSKAAMADKFATSLFVEKWEDEKLGREIEELIEKSRERALEEGKKFALNEVIGNLFAPNTGPLWRLSEQVSRGGDCSTKEPVVSALKEMANTLKDLNPFNDPRIEEIANSLKETFVDTRLSANQLRSDQAAREKVAAKIKEMKAKFSIA